MKIAVGCDPNAEEFKQQLIPFIEKLGHEVTDFGSDDSIYANVAIEVAENVAAKKFDRGILFCGTGIGVMCGTGIGISIAANKVKGAYAAVVGDAYSAQRACLSNNCNIITIGSQVTGYKKAEVMIEEYLKATYVYNERSGKKVDRILEYERTH